MTKRAVFLLGLGAICFFNMACWGQGQQARRLVPQAQSSENDEGRDLRIFLERDAAALDPMERGLNLLFWQAAAEGLDDWQRLAEQEMQLRWVFLDRDRFERLSLWRDQGRIQNRDFRRQLEMAWLAYRENQLPEPLLTDLVRRHWAVAQSYHGHQAKLNGQVVSEAALYDLLAHSQDNELRRKAYEAAMARGLVVAEPLRDLARMRNQAARQLGFDNYYHLQLANLEMDLLSLNRWLDILQKGTQAAWTQEKAHIDRALKERLDLGDRPLRPWHYEDPFFQQAPRLGVENPDRLLEGLDWASSSFRFFQHLGFDLKPALSQKLIEPGEASAFEAFFLQVDREGDFRLLARPGQGEQGLSILLHEFGHGAYALGIPSGLPWWLRQVAHPFVGEAVAILFSRLSLDAEWLLRWAQVPPSLLEQARSWLPDLRRRNDLVFLRWALVVVRFEQELYRDPEQDLNARFRQLRQEIQGVAEAPGRDAPDWAALLHLVSTPVHYQNYILGEMLACQLEDRLRTLSADSPGPWFQNPKSGHWLKEAVFSAGASLDWRALLQQALGHGLDEKNWLRAFVRPAIR